MKIAARLLLTTGQHTLQIDLPDVLPVETFARFRLSTQEGLSFHGDASDGEVEDYRITAGAEGDPVFATHNVNMTVAFGSLTLPAGTGFDNLDDVRAGASLSLPLTEMIRTFAFPPGPDFGQAIVDRSGR